VIRFAAFVLLALAVWRLLARRPAAVEIVTVGWDDGTARVLTERDPLRSRLIAIADRVVP
jgi:hypothetical protein